MTYCRSAIAVVIFLVPCLTSAQAITAVCKNPTGRALGIENAQVVNVPDGMSEGQFVISWTMGAQTAQVVSQGSTGRPIMETAALVHFSNEQASFVVDYPSAVWLYSLFVRPRYLLITQHTNGFALSTGGAVAKAFYASCDISAPDAGD